MTDVTTPTEPRTIDILDPRLYVVSRHEDVSHVSRDQELYSAARGVRPNVPAVMSIISMDDPEHTRQRRIISKGFTPRRVRELTEHMREAPTR